MLKEGDVIILKDGMQVYTKIPEMFVFENSLSEELIHYLVAVGEVYYNETSIAETTKKIAGEIVKHFLRAGLKIDHKDALVFVEDHIKSSTVPCTFKIKGGSYIVYKTSFEGGGTGMGPYDVFPDGHHVFCVKADNRKVKVDFYQSGCFTAMIKDIEPVSTAELKWKIKEIS